jgi:DNA-binding GntR family transcriptional regulator
MTTYRYEQVADDLRGKIRDGTYPPGSKLPSRKVLCQLHKVSEIVVRNACLILKIEGLLIFRNGSGLYIADPLPGETA